MHYNSVDHFLSHHQTDIAAILEAAQRTVGGHYSSMSPETLRQTAIHDAHDLSEALRHVQVDNQVVQQIARETDSAGIALDDLTRLTDEVAIRFVAFVEQQVTDQPELAADLLRRMRHANARYRANVTAVKIDKTLRQFGPP